MTDRIAGLDELIFYAIDKASPYALALNEPDNTLDKIRSLTLQQLSITSHGAANMWLWINGHSHLYGASPVPVSKASTANTVDAVAAAVYATIAAKAAP